MNRLIALAALSLTLAACTGSGAYQTAPDRPPARPIQGTCDAAPAKQQIGKTASEAVGATILADSGARTLRWGPPRSAWTMDYREDRVNVRYGDDMTITEITCG